MYACETYCGKFGNSPSSTISTKYLHSVTRYCRFGNDVVIAWKTRSTAPSSNLFSTVNFTSFGKMVSPNEGKSRKSTFSAQSNSNSFKVVDDDWINCATNSACQRYWFPCGSSTQIDLKLLVSGNNEKSGGARVSSELNGTNRQTLTGQNLSFSMTFKISQPPEFWESGTEFLQFFGDSWNLIFVLAFRARVDP